MFDDYIVLDTETTCRKGECHRVVEIAMILVHDDRIVMRYEQLFDPGEPISAATQKITGLKDSDVEGLSSFADVIPYVCNLIARYPVVGQNIAFDLAAIRSEVESAGKVYPSVKSCDVKEMAAAAMPELGHYGLKDICSALGVAQDDAHRAMADVLATNECFMRLKGKKTVTVPGLRRTAQKSLFANWERVRDVDLGGVSICLTGVFSACEREDMEKMIESLGGIPKSGVTKKLRYLAVGDVKDDRTQGALSGKHQKALEYIESGLPITILTEAELMDMLGFRKKEQSS